VIIGNETHSMGSIMSLLTMGHSLGMLLGPILGGVMMDAFQLETGFIIGTVVIFLGVIISLTLTANFHILVKDSV
jgi:DHA1 family multidrug resistance protein-like MFS transporter